MKNRKNTCELLGKIPKYCVNMPCEKCRLQKLSEYWDSVPKNGYHCCYGYILQQYPDGDYCIINRRTKKCVIHAQCTKRLTRREAKEHINFFINKIKNKKR